VTGKTRTTAVSRNVEEYGAAPQPTPAFETGPLQPAYLRQPFDVTDPVGSSPTLHAHGGRARDAGYELSVARPTRFFTHTDETEQQLGTLVVRAIDAGRRGASARLGLTASGRPEQPGGPPAHLEMFYTMGTWCPGGIGLALLRTSGRILAERCNVAAPTRYARQGDRIRRRRPAQLIDMTRRRRQRYTSRR